MYIHFVCMLCEVNFVVCQGLQFWAFTCNRGANPEFVVCQVLQFWAFTWILGAKLRVLIVLGFALLGIHMELRCKTYLSSVKVCNFGNSHGTWVRNLRFSRYGQQNMPFMISCRTLHKSVVACRYLSRIYSCEGFRVVKILPLVFWDSSTTDGG